MPGPMGPRPGHTTEKAKDFKGTTKKLIIKIQNWINNSIYFCCWKYYIFYNRT